MRLGVGSRECWLVIETLILPGNLKSHVEAKPCGFSQAGTGGGAVLTVQAERGAPLCTHLADTHRLRPREDLHVWWLLASHITVEFVPFL